MASAIKLKIASMMLFWFGVIFESIVIIGFSSQYVTEGIVKPLMAFPSDLQALNVLNFLWLGFGHLMHIISAFFLSKGNKSGAISALILSSYEIMYFLIFQPLVLSSPSGLVIRIYFVIIMVLMVLGRKELSKLQSQNWRPWKNPLHYY